MLLVMMTASLSGQLMMQRCLCSGEVSLALSAPHHCENCPPVELECGACGDVEQAPCDSGETEHTPCDRGDCFVFFLLPVLDLPVVLDYQQPVQHLAVVPVAIDEPRTSGERGSFQAPLPPRAPDRSPVGLTILYRSLLI